MILHCIKFIYSDILSEQHTPVKQRIQGYVATDMGEVGVEQSVSAGTSHTDGTYTCLHVQVGLGGTPHIWHWLLISL